MNILQAIDDPQVFAPLFRDPRTWAAWRSFLAALFALPMDADQRRMFTECTARDDSRISGCRKRLGRGD